ncbi:MAG TPA: dockerin type I domain-containing protein [Phycisphaerales bacterium]|nr:dockerin type I domain-containing protein [Phycisphaerales bacterium]HMP36855.1 dockerin type I domain-containing protein [Phycisphaerales bacterium]
MPLPNPASRAVAGCALAIAAAAPANVVINTWSSSSEFHHRRIGVPDQDQIRAGLPNEGICYCVPTSVMNLLMYIANHGFPQVVPGPGNHASPGAFPIYTGLIGLMGVAAGVGPGAAPPHDPDCLDPGGPEGDGICTKEPCGTSYAKLKATVLDPTGQGSLGWLAGAAGKLVVTTQYHAPPETPIAFTTLGKIAHQGAVLCVSFGVYVPAGTLFGTPIYQRSGGHSVTLNEILASGNSRLLFARDPAQGNGDPTAPSPYASRLYDCSQEDFLIADGLPGEAWSSINLESRTVLASPGAPLDVSTSGQAHPVRRLLGGYLAIRPKFGAFWKGPEISSVAMAAGFAGTGAPGAETSWPLGEATLVDLAIDRDLVGWYALTASDGAGPASLVHIDPLGDGGLQITPLAATDATRLVLGRRAALFTMDPAARVVETFSATGKRLATASLDGVPAAIAFADATDRVVVLTLGDDGGASIVELAEELERGAPAIVHPLPAGAITSPRAAIAIDPLDPTTVWIASRDEGALTAFALDPTGASAPVAVAMIAGLTAPASIDFDDAGVLHVADEGVARLFARGLDGGWSELFGHALEGVAIGPVLRIARSRTNFDPALHATPSWQDAPADLFGDPAIIGGGLIVPDCQGDLNGDGTVDGADLGLFIAAWGTQSLGSAGAGIADLDGDGTVGGSDLGILLSRWGSCPE